MANKPKRNPASTTPGYADRRARGGGRMCKSKTKDNVRCGNPAQAGREFCYLHPLARPAVQPVKRVRASAPALSPSTDRSRQEMQRTYQQVSLVVDAARAVQALAAAGWEARARQYFEEQVGERAWGRIEAAWLTDQCKKFAAVADDIEACSHFLGHFDTIDKRVPAINTLLLPLSPLALHARQAIVLLRTAGVFICLSRGKLGGCRCLKAMLDESSIGPRLITTVLDSAIGNPARWH